MLPPWTNGQRSDSLDLTSPTGPYPNAVSGATCGKTGITPQQASDKMFLPESSSIGALPTEMDALGTSVSRSDRAMDMLWIPHSSSVSDDTPQKIRRGFFAEKNMVFLSCCQQYPKAIGWSLLLFLTVVMEGYDKSLITGFFAFPAFRRKYGQPTLAAKSNSGYEGYEISPAWQTGLQNAAIACEIIGLLVHGYITYIVGYRKVMIGSLVWLCLAVLPAVFAKSIKVLLVAQALSGIPWGVIQTLAATYAAEVVPSGMRPYVLSNINMCWVAGQLLGSGVLRALVYNNSEWSYRLPFALQWAWAVPLLVGVWFAPESPWWCIRHEKPAEARHSLRRLSKRTEPHIDDSIALMEHINEIEKKLNYGGATYTDLFKGVNRRRTEISCMVWMCQALGGNVLSGYAPYFFEQAGFSTSNSFNLSIGMYGMAFIAGMVSWVLLAKVGRRTLYMFGLASATVLLIGGGLASAVSGGSNAGDWSLGAFIILSTFTYDLTIGPVCYVVVAELPSTRLRVKTVALARVAYNLVSLVNNILVPRMLSPAAWGIAGKVCFAYAGTSFLCLIWCYIRLPETKGLSYLELDILFEKKASAHKFGQVQNRLAQSAYMTVSNAESLTNAWHGWLAYS